MAKLDILGPYVDLIGATATQWTVVTTASDHVVYTSQFLDLTISGNFTIGAGGQVAGTTTGVNVYSRGFNGAQVLRATDLSVDAAKLVDVILGAKYDADVYAFLFSGDDTITGSTLHGAIQGFGGNDTIRAGAGDDRIGASAGNDSVDGGAGFDVAVFQGVFANYKVERTANGYTITDLKGSGGTDTLTNVERAWFNDKNVALITPDSTGGQLVRLYQAALGRLPDEPGLTYWQAQVEDHGVKLEALAGSFIQSAEYQQLYGSVQSNRDLVAKYYEHILHRAPEQGGLDFWAGVLDGHKATSAQVLAAISESPENLALSVQLIGNGLVFDAPVITY
ncbi:DUF4214 domain-containing protein [Massilia solisilvae]|uniref:DUF4214 domain-containing protein n=1 Tax=Massilia solisilvae TaxID=1811225 RepID=A0ABT2BLR2_9BURK|nr:DUF4214 domain-containing protein [Massilia solisilvae]MCS0609437.1 DUF4214 domain-containing protein [Massilia solisilvae]